MNVIMLACHKAGRSDCCCNCTQCIETAPAAAAAPTVGRRHQLPQLRVNAGRAVRSPHRLQGTDPTLIGLLDVPLPASDFSISAMHASNGTGCCALLGGGQVCLIHCW